MGDKTILIIGAGVAGLSAGCYAQMNGYQTHIFEMHDLPGGLCTAWERKGYIFDGCIHYLFDSGDGMPFNAMWRELGAVQNRPMIQHDEYQRLSDGQHTLIVYADPDRLERHMLEIAPYVPGCLRPARHDVQPGRGGFDAFSLKVCRWQRRRGAAGGAPGRTRIARTFL